MNRLGKSYGVTLIELICVMACLSILVGLTVSSWLFYRVKIQRNTALRRVQRAIEYARVQAMTLQTPMIYCGSSDGLHCDGGWHRGQIIHARNNTLVLKRYLPVGKVRLSFHANFGRYQKIEFMRTGFTNGQEGRFDFCVKSVFAIRPCRSLILHFSGQVVG